MAVLPGLRAERFASEAQNPRAGDAFHPWPAARRPVACAHFGLRTEPASSEEPVRMSRGWPRAAFWRGWLKERFRSRPAQDFAETGQWRAQADRRSFPAAGRVCSRFVRHSGCRGCGAASPAGRRHWEEWSFGSPSWPPARVESRWRTAVGARGFPRRGCRSWRARAWGLAGFVGPRCSLPRP